MKSKQMAILAAMSISNIAFVFAFQWYIVTSIGSGLQTDALFAAMMVPNFVLAIVSSSLTHVLVPILSAHREGELEEKAWLYFYLVGIFFAGIALLIILTNKYWLGLLLPGFAPEQLTLTINLLNIQSISIVGTSLVAVLEATSHAKLKFYNVELIKNIVGLTALLALAFSIDVYGIYAAAIIFSARPLISVLLMLRHLGRWRYQKFVMADVKIVWDRLKYLIAGTAYYKTDPLLDRFLLSMASTGSITLYHLSQQIYSAGSTVMNRAISAPMVPMLSRHANKSEWLTFKSHYTNRLYLTLALSVVAIAFVFLFGEYFLTLLFHHRNFSASSVHEMWLLMMALSGVFIGGSLGQVLANSFYAYGNTRTPTQIGIAGYTIGIFMKIAGFYFYGIIGLAVAATAYYLLNACLLYFFLARKIEHQHLHKSGVTV